MNVISPMELNLGPLAPHHIAEVIAGLVVFAVLWFIIAKFVGPAFEAMYAERASEIEGGIMRAEKAQAEADAMRKEYNDQLEAAKAEATQIREDARAQGATILEQMREQANRESTRMVEQAKLQIDAERQSVANQLRGEIGGMATTLAERIVGESLADDERATRTVDRFLEELSTQPARD